MTRKAFLLVLGLGIVIALLWSLGGKARHAFRVATKAESAGTEFPFASAANENTSILSPRVGTKAWMTDLVGRDPKALLSWIQRECPAGERREAISILLSAWLAMAPQDAGNAVITFQESQVLKEYVIGLSSQWNLRELADSEVWIGRLQSELAMMARKLLCSRVAEVPFEEATRITMSLSGKLLEQWIDSVVTFWESSKSEAIIDWCSHVDAGTSTAILQLFLPLVAKRDPQLAASQADAHGAAVPFDTRRRIALQWALKDPNSALDWTSTFGTDAQKGVAVRGILEKVAEKDPVAAANATAQIEDPAVQAEARVDILEAWAKQDPERAAAWLATFPEGKARRDGSAAVAAAYVKRDWHAAGRWIETLPISANRDALLGEFVQDIQSFEPEAAMEWAGKIQNEPDRLRRSRNALAEWSKIDPAAAAAWKAQNVIK